MRALPIHTYYRTENPYLEYDYENNLTQKYEYDSLGRLVRQYGNTKSTDVNRFIGQYRYDKSNNVTKVTNKADGLTLTASYSYNGENIPTKTTMSSSVAYSYAYDSLNRLSKTSLQTTASTPIEITYSYCTSDRNGEGESLYRTTQIRNETIDGKTYRYDYDKNGNITKIYEKTASDTNYVLKQSYSYDSLGQLVRVNDKNLNKTILYTYDNGGNMLSQKEYAYTTGTVGTATKTVSYGYNNSAGCWGDKLRSITTDGTKQSFTYDKIGNPLTYRDGMSFTWQGRQMKTADLNGTAVSYKYNSDGLRSYKKVGSTVHEYEYLGDKLMYEKRGSYQFHYRYDAFGNLAGITREDASGSLYRVYVLCNSRGDVLELRNQNGTVFAKYVYDAWGNVLHVLNSAGNEITSTTNLANQNPFRYRGYYYDSESGLYYLQSRYYDPVTGRFLNADDIVVINLVDCNNIFLYCNNNPANNADYSGHCYYDAKGNWCHDNWEYLDGYERKPDPRIGATKSNVNGVKIDPDDYDDDSYYSTNDRLRSSDAKRREKKQIDDAFGKDRSKREDKSRDLHDSKKGRGNDVNIPFGDLKSGDFWKSVKLIGYSTALAWLLLNDSSGIGVVDDVAVPYVVGLMQEAI